MLGKLLRHEFAYTAKRCLPALGITLLFALLTRGLVALFSSAMEEPYRYLAETLLVMVNYITMLAGAVIVSVIIVVRFYRHLVTDQGYLTFTLPVTPTQLIISKLIPAFVWQLLSTAVMLLIIVVTFAGTLMMTDVGLGEIGEIFGYVVELMIAESAAGYYIAVVLFVLLLLVSYLMNTLMYYASIAIGQIVPRHKLIGSIIAYVAISMIIQIATSLVTTPFMLSLGTMAVETGADMFRILNLMLLVILLVYILVGVTYFLITRYVLTKKLNLD